MTVNVSLTCNYWILIKKTLNLHYYIALFIETGLTIQ